MGWLQRLLGREELPPEPELPFRLTYDREEIRYWEDDRSYGFFWSPGLIAVPDEDKWSKVMPDWLLGRRDEVLANLRQHTNCKIEEGGY
ncbi:hypothetical protein [Actinoplanes sp. L3-i22]|uniref:hypothetical protein n=1 Tax=Actinoplanes sp. L3-i22 TaxID=2836373 RepID=UPI001C781E96|nr:hypothetical protein [Actinoplanes sp. L3-i22]BCY07065.1 hypothetical protein L3i22_021530 [Actinoplanes sp. L3-i22]